MQTLKLFAFPVILVAIWFSLAAGTLLGFTDFALATNPPAKTTPAPTNTQPAPVLTATR